jgi:hypothetical protein
MYSPNSDYLMVGIIVIIIIWVIAEHNKDKEERTALEKSSEIEAEDKQKHEKWLKSEEEWIRANEEWAKIEGERIAKEKIEATNVSQPMSGASDLYSLNKTDGPTRRQSLRKDLFSSDTSVTHNASQPMSGPEYFTT